jgi:hypothetical protein
MAHAYYKEQLIEPTVIDENALDMRGRNSLPRPRGRGLEALFENEWNPQTIR